MIDYGNFSKALKNLELQYDNYKNLDDELPELMKEAVAESVIQRFEICYDCLWKDLKRYLTEELGIPNVRNSPKPVLKLLRPRERSLGHSAGTMAGLCRYPD